MADKFNLLERLTKESTEENPLPKGFKYKEYAVVVENKKEKVFIPERESRNFEEELSPIKYLDRDDFKDILRKYRGIRK